MKEPVFLRDPFKLPSAGRVKMIIVIANLLTVMAAGFFAFINGDWKESCFVTVSLVVGEWLMFWISFKWAMRLYGRFNT